MPYLGSYIGFALGVVAAGGLLWVAFGLGTKPSHLNVLLLIAGALIGWAGGILIIQFSEFGKALSTFISGYLVAKLDKLFETSVSGNVSEMSIGRVALFASGIALGGLLTFIWRAYVSAPA
jgi:hypothetical protein